MGEVVPMYTGGGSPARRSIDTSYSRRQYAIKKVANNPEIKRMMKSMLESPIDEPSYDNHLNTDTYANMRELAKDMKGIEEIQDPVLGGQIIADGLALTHFHALQDILSSDPYEDSWGDDIKATAAWPQPIRKEREAS
jgi:hypothetical protein